MRFPRRVGYQPATSALALVDKPGEQGAAARIASTGGTLDGLHLRVCWWPYCGRRPQCHERPLPLQSSHPSARHSLHRPTTARPTVVVRALPPTHLSGLRGGCQRQAADSAALHTQRREAGENNAWKVLVADAVCGFGLDASASACTLQPSMLTDPCVGGGAIGGAAGQVGLMR